VERWPDLAVEGNGGQARASAAAKVRFFFSARTNQILTRIEGREVNEKLP
jgi:hypothetical protein